MQSFAVVMSALPGLEVLAELLADVVEVRILNWCMHWGIGCYLHLVVQESTSSLLELLAIISELAGALRPISRGHLESDRVVVQEGALPLHELITVHPELAWSSAVTTLHIHRYY